MFLKDRTAAESSFKIVQRNSRSSALSAEEWLKNRLAVRIFTSEGDDCLLQKVKGGE